MPGFPALRAPSIVVLLAACLLVGSGCGSKSSTSGASTSTPTTATVHLAKTKFVLHAGLAFGAFHRYIYKPLRNGTLTGGGLLKHKLALVKAGLAGLFAYHELKLALADARASPLLSKLLAPILALQTKLQALAARLRGGHADAAAIGQANSDVSGLNRLAGQAGQPVADQPTPALGG
jgi:hypothetical protein